MSISVSQTASDGKAASEELQGVSPVRTTYRKVAILGSADSSIRLAPVGDESWELWGLPWSHDPNVFKGITKWFDPHPLEWMKGRHKDYVEQLNSLAPSPVYMIEAHPDIQNSVRYPIETILSQFTGYRNRPQGSFASTIAYEVAFAIMEGVDEIGLWGVDLLTEGEYAIQRPNTEYLLGYAEGKGIKLTIPPESALLKGNHSYGYETVPTNNTGITSVYLRERRLKYQQTREKSMARAQTYDGALQACHELAEVKDVQEWDINAWLMEKMQNYQKERENAMAQAQTFDGAYQEADSLLTQVVHWERGGVVPANDNTVEG